MIETKKVNPDELMQELKVAASSLFALAGDTVAEVGMAMGGDSALEEAGRFNSEIIQDDNLLLKWYQLNKHSVGDKMVDAVYDLTGEYLLAKGLITQKYERKAYNSNSVVDRFSDPAEFYRIATRNNSDSKDSRLFLMSMLGMIVDGRVEEILKEDLCLLLECEEQVHDVLEWNETVKELIVTNLKLRNVVGQELI